MPRVTITVPEKTPQPYRFQLDRESVSLGRGSENDIPIDCASISVKHAEMRRVEGGYELRDLGSTNGIKLADERREVIRLRNGLPVKMGDVEFDFLLTDEELATLAAEKPEDDGAMKLPPLKDLPEQTTESDEPELEETDAGGGGGFGMILLFLILAAAAFVAGMAIRHQKETGGSLIEALQEKFSTAETPATEPPAAAPATPDEAPAAE